MFLSFPSHINPLFLKLIIDNRLMKPKTHPLLYDNLTPLTNSYLLFVESLLNIKNQL